EAADAVMTEHPLQPDLEALGDAGPLDVEGLQVTVEVLARAVHRAARFCIQVASRPVAAQLRHVGEYGEQFRLAWQRLPAELGSRCKVTSKQPLAVCGVAVEAGQRGE